MSEKPSSIPSPLQQILFTVLGISDKHEPYKVFPRVKILKNGTTKIRWISAPCKDLLKIQRQILYKILYAFPMHASVHGYCIGRSIRTGASIHCKHKHLIILDIKQFFPSITKERLKKVLTNYREYWKSNPLLRNSSFQEVFAWDSPSHELCIGKSPKWTIFQSLLKGQNIEIPKLDSLDLLLEVCTFNNVLPQGAPTSGGLSNIVMYMNDCAFEQTAGEKKIAYSRYADDLAFSGDDLETLKQYVFGFVFKRLKFDGFTVNMEKVHIRSDEHRRLTGLTISENGTRPERKFRRNFRALMATTRNGFSRVKTSTDCDNLIAQYKFLHKHFGNLYYLGYTDSNSNVYSDMIRKYFLPIAKAIEGFYPGFLDPKITLLKDELFLNLRIKFIRICNGASNTPSIPFNWAHILSNSSYSYQQKRDWAKSFIANKETGGIDLRSFRKAFRITSPEDRVALLKMIIVNIEKRKEYLTKDTLVYAARVDYESRLEIIRCLEEVDKKEHFVTMSWTQKIGRVFRGIRTTDLGGFLTSTNEAFRNAALQCIEKRNRLQMILNV